VVDPIAIEEPDAAGPARCAEACIVPATATPPINRAPARETAPTPDHHNRVAGLARLHPLPKRPIGVAIVRLPVSVPQGTAPRIDWRHDHDVTPGLGDRELQTWADLAPTPTGTVSAVRCPSVVETWGSAPHERESAYPCDGLIDRPHVVFRAVDIDAPGPLVFRWVCQLRKAPYSYDWIDNLGRRSPRELIEGLDHLEVGQRFMVIFRLSSFEEDRSITLDSTTAPFGRVVCTYRVVPTAPDRSRLVVKLLFAVPPGPRGWLTTRLLPVGDLVMMRKQLLTLKALAERDARPAGTRPPAA
jgi:hypothetical protein